MAATVSFITFKNIIRHHFTFRSYWQFPYIKHKLMTTTELQEVYTQYTKSYTGRINF